MSVAIDEAGKDQFAVGVDGLLRTRIFGIRW